MKHLSEFFNLSKMKQKKILKKIIKLANDDQRKIMQKAQKIKKCNHLDLLMCPKCDQAAKIANPLLSLDTKTGKIKKVGPANKKLRQEVDRTFYLNHPFLKVKYPIKVSAKNTSPVDQEE